MKRKNKQFWPLVASGSAFAIWGLNTPLVKISLTSVPLFSLLLLKYTVGAVFFMLLAHKKWKPVTHDVRTRIILATILGYTLTSVLLYKGIELAGGLNASLIYLLAPLILYFSSIRFLKERYNSKLLFGVIAGLSGALLIVGAPLLLSGGSSKTNLLGNLLVFVTVFVDVSGTIIIKPVFKKVSVMQLTASRFVIAAISLVPFALFEIPKLSHLHLSGGAYIAVGYNIIFSTLIAYYLYHWGLNKISGEQLSPLHYLDPMVGTIGSIIILNEKPSIATVAGILLIGFGLYFGEGHKMKFKHHFGHHR